jgi:hypothetical protein
MSDDFKERRSEYRTVIDDYFCVEFQFESVPLTYVCKVWDLSSGGISILVKQDSDLFNHLQKDAIMKMRFYSMNSSTRGEFMQSKVIHITRPAEEKYKNHYLVGLSILE